MSVIRHYTGEARHAVKAARKLHWCNVQSKPASGCNLRIAKGAPYLRITIFPNHEFLASDRPYVMRMCQACVEWWYPDTTDAVRRCQ